MKALIVYHSRKGTTRKFAEKIAERLFNKNVDVIQKILKKLPMMIWRNAISYIWAVGQMAGFYSIKNPRRNG